MFEWILIFSIFSMLLFLESKIKNGLFYYTLVIFVIAVAAFRYRLGYDYDSYLLLFQIIFYLKNPLVTDPGWYVINWISYSIFNSEQFIFIISSVIIYSIIFHFYFKHTKHAYWAAIFFLITTYLLWESLSLMRQYLACSFFLLALPNLFKKKPVNFIFWILVASLFHKTALIALFVYPFSSYKLKPILALIFLTLGTFLLPVIFDNFTLLSYFIDYEFYKLNSFSATQNSGVVFYIRVLIFCLILILTRDTNKFNEFQNQIINIYIAGSLIYLALYSSTALRRISYYFLVLEPLVVTYLIKAPFEKRLKNGLQKIFMLTYLGLSISTFYFDIVSKSDVLIENSLLNRKYDLFLNH